MGHVAVSVPCDPVRRRVKYFSRYVRLNSSASWVSMSCAFNSVIRISLKSRRNSVISSTTIKEKEVPLSGRPGAFPFSEVRQRYHYSTGHRAAHSDSLVRPSAADCLGTSLQHIRFFSPNSVAPQIQSRKNRIPGTGILSGSLPF